jgi:predicted secreted protein
MPIQTPLAVAIFLTIWWIVLFAILPLGVRSLHEDGETPAGSDPGAPMAPMLIKKGLITTAVSILVFGAFLLIVKAMG